MPHVDLVKELFQVCLTNDYDSKKLTFSPDVEGYNSNYLFYAENNALEVIIFKSTLKRIFVECHHSFNKSIPFDITKYQETELVELYYMTIGILLITNENHTSINIHNQIVAHILNRPPFEPFANLLLDPRTFLDKELTIIELLLNSNNNKLNKSSSLWHLYKKLLIQKHLRSGDTALMLDRFINVTLKSCELHPTNYYAWNFMRWLNKYERFYTSTESKIIPKVESFCQRNTNDAASWSCLADVLTFIWDSQSTESFKFELQKLGASRISTIEPLEDKDPDFVETKLNFLIDWIIDHQITSIVPYQSIKKLFIYLISRSKLETSSGCRKVKRQTEEFANLLQQKGIEFEIKNGYHELNVNLDTDLILSNQIQCHINWVRTLNWVEKQIQNFKNKIHQE